MLDPEILQKYLAGQATDDEVQQCEEYLSDPQNRVDLEEPDRDSLLETVRNFSGDTTRIVPDEKLVQQLRSMVPARPIGQEELDRILSPAEESDQMGRIGRFHVVEFIASGGMGLVFKAIDPQLDRTVCIKVLHPMLSTHVEAKARFAREAKAAARLRNERIVTVFEVGEHRELPFLVMQLLDGQSMRNRMESDIPVSAAAARKYTRQIAEGLRYAHGLGFLHRDIKPENIWITPEDDIKLLDFGLARAVNETTHLTNTGTIIGTPSYMSPEQVQGKELNARSDLFSLGSVLFEMLTGKCAFNKGNVFSTMMSVANETPPMPAHTDGNAIPPDMLPVVIGLLEKDAENRIASAEELIEQLESSPSLLTSSAGKSGNRFLTLTIGALAGAALIALGMWLYQISDKGKLIVEAAPGIEVSVKDETIKVVDPQTGKEYVVRVGETPLPSGVYQLEVESDGFALASNVISIKRGRTEIVRLSLKPNADPTANANAGVLPGVTDSAIDDPDGGNSAGDLAATENSIPDSPPVMTLDQIPTLSAAEVRQQLGITNQITPESLMISGDRRKEIIAEIGGSKDSLVSVESSAGTADRPIRAAGVYLNEDGSFVAKIFPTEPLFIYIFDLEGVLQCMIPTQDKVQSICWSPDPDIFAAVIQGGARKRVVLWKLVAEDRDKEENGDDPDFSARAEVLRVIKVDALRVGWSWDGMKLALTSDQILFYDLVTGTLTAPSNSGLNQIFSQRPWSPCGRYFATVNVNVGISRAGDGIEEKEVREFQIWDMQEDRLIRSMSGCRWARFLNTEPEEPLRLLLYRDGIEIWNLHRPASGSESKPDFVREYKSDVATRSGFATDSRGRVIVYVSEDGKLVIDNAVETKACELPPVATEPVIEDQYRVYLSGDGRRVILRSGDRGEYYAVSKSPIDLDSLTEEGFGGIDWEVKKGLLPNYEFVSPRASPDGQHVSYRRTSIGNRRSVNRLVELETLNTTSVSESTTSINKPGAAFSPDGKWMGFLFEVENKEDPFQNNRRRVDDDVFVGLFNIETGKMEHEFEAPEIFRVYDADRLFWSEDSSSLFVFQGSTETVSSVLVMDVNEAGIEKIEFNEDLFADFDIAKDDNAIERGRKFDVAYRPALFNDQLFFPVSISHRGRNYTGDSQNALAVFDLKQRKISGLISLTFLNATRLRGMDLSRVNKLVVNEWFIGIHANISRTGMKLIDRSSNSLIDCPDAQSFGLSPHGPSYWGRGSGELFVAQVELESRKIDSVRKLSEFPELDPVFASWHPEKPELGWSLRGESFASDSDSETIVKGDTSPRLSSNPSPTSSAIVRFFVKVNFFEPVPDGWLAIGNSRWRKIGFDNEVLKTYFVNAEGEIATAIDRNGRVQHSDKPAPVRMVILDGNRFMTLPLPNPEESRSPAP